MMNDWDVGNVSEILDDYEENGEFYESINEIIESEVDKRVDESVKNIRKSVDELPVIRKENDELLKELRKLKSDYKKSHDAGYKDGENDVYKELFNNLKVGDSVFIILKNTERNTCDICSGHGYVTATFNGDKVNAKCPNEKCVSGFISTSKLECRAVKIKRISINILDWQNKKSSTFFTEYIYKHRTYNAERKLSEIFNTKEECELEIKKIDQEEN